MGAHSSHTVLGVGSSIALSSVLPVRPLGVPEPVGVLDDHHLVAPLDRRQRRAVHQLAHVLDVEHRGLGAGHADVGVRAGERRTAGVALAAARAALALQGGGEGDRGVGATGPGRAGEQPGVRHPLARDRPLEGRDGVRLADQRGPDAASVTSTSGAHALGSAVGQTGRSVRTQPGSSSGRAGPGSRPAISSTGLPGVDHEVVLGGRRGELQEHLAHPLVELDRLGLDAVALLEPGQALLRARGRARTVRCGRRSPVAQRATRSTLAVQRGPGRRPGRRAWSRRSGR